MSTNLSSEDTIATEVWQSLGADSSGTLWWLCLSAVIQGMLVAMILSKTLEYFEYFRHSDGPYLSWGIGIGTTVLVCDLALTCSQVHSYIYDRDTKPASSLRFLILADLTTAFLGACFNWVTGGYYCWRTYRMSKMNPWVIPPFVIGILAQITSCLITVVHGYQLPQMNDPTTLIMELVHWQKKLAKLSTIWGSITLSVDATICLFMIIILFSSRDSVFHKETRIFTRVISLTFETMLPPVIILVILLSLYGKSSTPMSDVRQVMICALPPLYYNSALHTLVGRRSVRRILDAKLAADGVRMLSGQFHGDSSSQTLYRKGGGAHSPFIHAGVVENTGDIEEYQKMTMFGGKGKMGMTPPMISVETSTFISEPDRRAEQKRSVNRGWVEDDLDDISEASVSADIKEEALTPELTEPIISIEMIARSCASDDLVVHPGRY